jgi:hypothetical protein
MGAVEWVRCHSPIRSTLYCSASVVFVVLAVVEIIATLQVVRSPWPDKTQRKLASRA